MRRGERECWRRIARAAQKVAESDDFAKEYMAKGEFQDAMVALENRQAETRLRGEPWITELEKEANR